MTLMARNEGGTFTLAPAGTHVARCCWVIDLGLQDGTYGIKSQVLLGWELPYEQIPDGDRKGEPFFVSKRYTVSLNEKANLRRDLEAWRGKKFTKKQLDGFSLDAIAGQPCQVVVSHKDREGGGISTKVESVTAMPKGGGPGCPEAVNPQRVFNLDEPDLETFEALPDWVKKVIDGRVQVTPQDMAPPADDEPRPEDMGDDVPF